MREKAFYDDSGDYDTFYAPAMSQKVCDNLVNNLILLNKPEVSKAKLIIKTYGIEPTWRETVQYCPHCSELLNEDNGWPSCSCSTTKIHKEALRKEVFCLANYIPPTSYEAIPEYDNTIYRDLKGNAVLIESKNDNDIYIWKKLPEYYRLAIMRVKQKNGTKYHLREENGKVDVWILMNDWVKTTETGGLVDIRPEEAFVSNPIATLPYLVAINKDELEAFSGYPYVYAFKDTMWTRNAILAMRTARPGLKMSATMAERIQGLQKRIHGPKRVYKEMGGWNISKCAAIEEYISKHPNASIRELKRELHMDYKTIKQALSALGFYR